MEGEPHKKWQKQLKQDMHQQQQPWVVGCWSGRWENLSTRASGPDTLAGELHLSSCCGYWMAISDRNMERVRRLRLGVTNRFSQLRHQHSLAVRRHRTGITPGLPLTRWGRNRTTGPSTQAAAGLVGLMVHKIPTYCRWFQISYFGMSF
jgi:hypothetical protein